MTYEIANSIRMMLFFLCVIGATGLVTVVFLLLEIRKSMATAAQALTDLQTLIANLTAAINQAATDFTDLIEQVSALNGLNPTAVEAVVAQGKTALATLQASVASANAELNPAATSVTVSPATATLAAGATQQFTASVAGTTNQAVTWSALSGSITSGGLYTAPASGASDTVTATSQQTTTVLGTAAVTIGAPATITVSISPTTAGPIAQGSTQQFAATTNDTAGVNWTATAGTISASGLWTPPTPAGGTATITATSVTSPTASATATVTY